MGRIIDRPKNPSTQENKHRAHLLPFAFYNVVSDMVKKLDLAFHEIPKFLFENMHFGLNRDLYFFEVWFHQALKA